MRAGSGSLIPIQDTQNIGGPNPINESGCHLRYYSAIRSDFTQLHPSPVIYIQER